MENLNNIKTGQTYKSYRQVCYALGQEVKTSNSKKGQLKEWARYFEWEREGHKYIITKKHNEPKKKVDNRGGSNRVHDGIAVEYPNKCELILNDYGNDLTKLTKTSTVKLLWLCESCGVSFDDKISNCVVQKRIKCKVCSKSKGEQKVIKTLNKYNVKYEMEIKFDDLKYIKHLRFDFGIYDNGVLVGIIEFDGQYHDLDEGTIIRDTLKNKYCKENNIPLLRLHHKDKELFNFKLLSFLKYIIPSIRLPELESKDLDNKISELKALLNGDFIIK